MKDTTLPDINELIIEQMADAMIYSDSQGIIDGWNPAAEALFGYCNDEAIGQSLDLIIPEHLRDAHWTGFNRAMASGSTKNRGRAAITRSLTKTRGTIVRKALADPKTLASPACPLPISCSRWPTTKVAPGQLRCQSEHRIP